MYVKVYNQIFEYGLTPTELKVYIYLSHCVNILNTTTVRVKTIMERCSISSKTTVHDTLAALESKGLVASKNRFGHEQRRISNQYQINVLTGRWFALELDHGVFTISKRDFAVWLYLKCKASRAGRAFPSITMMAEALNLCRQTIVDAIKDLVAGGWIVKAKQWLGKHNLYLLQSDHPQEQKKSTAAMLCSNVTCSTGPLTKVIKNTSIIARALQYVKSNIAAFYKWVGSLKNGPQ